MKTPSFSALSSDSGAVQSSFSHVTPSSAVFQVIVGGPSFGGGAAAASAPGGAAASAVTPPAAEEKEESDDDMGFSLFD